MSRTRTLLSVVLVVGSSAALAAPAQAATSAKRPLRTAAQVAKAKDLRAAVLGAHRATQARAAGKAARSGAPAPFAVLTFQVDRYLPATTTQARALDAASEDGALAYREDGPRSAYGKAGSLWGHSRYMFVDVPISEAQAEAWFDLDKPDLTGIQAFYTYVAKTINAATPATIGDVATDLFSEAEPASRVGRASTYAWMLEEGATKSRPWGASTRLEQGLFSFLDH